MAAPSFLSWPFFEPRHGELHAAVVAWCDQNCDAVHGGSREAVDAQGDGDRGLGVQQRPPEELVGIVELLCHWPHPLYRESSSV